MEAIKRKWDGFDRAKTMKKKSKLDSFGYP